MTNQLSTLVALNGCGTAVIALLTIPSLQGAIQNLRTGKKTKSAPTLYTDHDGSATEESQAAYSVKYPVAAACLTSLLGLVASIILAVLSTLRLQSASAEAVSFAPVWLLSGAWALTLINALDLIWERQPVSRFQCAICGSLSSTMLLCLIGQKLWTDSQGENSVVDLEQAMGIVQLVAVLLMGLSFLSIPRRPDVYSAPGRMVERQQTVSALSRVSIAWPTGLVEFAGKREKLEVEDLPALAAVNRSTERVARFTAMNYTGSLWRAVFLAHWPQFLLVWTMVLIQAFLYFAPRYAMWQLLQILERRTAGESIAKSEAWTWVIVLGTVSVFSNLLDTQLNWASWSLLGLPIRAELSALIFRKALQRKDCKEPPKEKELVKDAPAKADKADKSKDTTTPTAGAVATPRTEQGTINLIAIDTFRVCVLAAFSQMYWMTVFQLILGIVFLCALVGWKCFLAGLATNLLSFPVNAYFSRVYADYAKKVREKRDDKVRVVTEAIQGIRQIKFAALESEWEERIGAVRKEELGYLWHCFLADSIQTFAAAAGPVMLATVTLATYVYINKDLPASIAFTALGVLGQLEWVMGVLPDLITFFINSKISIDRIDEYFHTPDRLVNRSAGDSITFKHARITFPSEAAIEKRKDPFTLHDLNLEFPNAELSVISGKTGSGKSLLLAAILGEAELLEGTITVPELVPAAQRFDHKAAGNNWILPSAIAYVSQIPWIENASIKNNVLFGLPLDEDRYQRVVEACALIKDFEMLIDGDQTEVGAQGISLSGGQRWRLTLARALYSRAGILILDDLFSALDAHVGKHVYEKALTGDLAQGRTRILVTHHVALCLPKTKYAVSLADGTVERAGFVEELERQGGLDEILRAGEEVTGLPQEGNEAATGSTNGAANGNANGPANGQAKAPEEGPDGAAKGAPPPKKLVEDEGREKGAVKISVYKGYLRAGGGIPFWVLIFFAYVAAQAFSLGRSWWVKIWTSDYADSSITPHFVALQYQPAAVHSMLGNTTSSLFRERESVGYYLGIYAAISFIAIVAGTLRYFALYVGSLNASRQIFRDMTATVLRMPLRWIDTVPLGRILNRFTSDINAVDTNLGREITLTVVACFRVLGVVVAGLFISPYVIILAGTFFVVCLSIAKRYLKGAREIKRLESTKKSPIFETFGSALKGISTIRAFDNVEAFTSRMYGVIDQHTSSYWHVLLFTRWAMLRMSLVGCLFSAGVATFIVSQPSITASLAGFALAFALEYAEGAVTAMAMYANMELDMNAAERVLEYTKLETEDQGGIEVPAAWPAEGRLEVEKLVVGYAPGLPDILKGLSFTIEKHERVGVVGRTGAGKSSLTLALFRFLEARSGSVHIDGIDIARIKLHDLRSRLAIIPQDPVLFSGTIRSNLDPFTKHTDHDLREALQRVHLVHSPESRDEADEAAAAPEDSNVNIFESLASPISEGGGNLSQGQRQLLCLARAITARPKVMVLDEATSAVDMATDVLIQRSIREEFGNTTLLVIAHRLSTIADFDRILVLDDGRAIEYGTPTELLAKSDGVFAGMVASSGEAERIREMIHSTQTP